MEMELLGPLCPLWRLGWFALIFPLLCVPIPILIGPPGFIPLGFIRFPLRWGFSRRLLLLFSGRVILLRGSPIIIRIIISGLTPIISGIPVIRSSGTVIITVPFSRGRRRSRFLRRSLLFGFRTRSIFVLRRRGAWFSGFHRRRFLFLLNRLKNLVQLD